MVCSNLMKSSSRNNTQAAQLKVCSINICGMSDRSQLTLDKYCYDNSIDILAVQESKSVNPANYQLKSMDFITDTNSSANKGSLLYVNDNKLSVSKLSSISEVSKNIDSAWGLVSGKGLRTIIGSIYLKLNYKCAIKDLIKMLNEAKKISVQLKAKGILLLGDFNSRHRLWGDKTENDYGKQLVENINFQEFSILSSSNPTFLSSNGSSNIDFLISSIECEHLFSIVKTDPEVELFSGAPVRGHVPIITSFTPPSYDNQLPPPKKRIDIKSVNWVDWKDAIETSLSSMAQSLEQLSVHQKWQKFDQICYDATKQYAKCKISSVHSKPYWTKALTDASNTLRAATKVYSKRNTHVNKLALESAKENFEDTRKSECQKFVLSKTKNLNAAQSTQFWKEFKRMFSKKIDRKVELLSNSTKDSILTDPEDIENALFSSFFEGAHLLEKGQDFDNVFFEKVNELYDNILLEEMDNIENLSDIKDSCDIASPIRLSELSYFINKYEYSGKGFDNHNFHPEMLKHLGPIAKKCILEIFNACLESGDWVWDLADVIFLKKEGKKDFTKTGSYRPISISSYIGKVFEQIIASRLERFLTSKGITDQFQEGFRKGRNTVRYLNRLDSDIRDKLSKKYTVICLFIDFEKAFDSVWKRGLMKKLYDIGIRSNIWMMLNSFLFSRKVKLIFNDYTGIVRACREFGLPQGSALSPILFRFFLHDLGEELVIEYDDDIAIYKFADDGTLRVIGGTTSKCLCNLKSCCEAVYKWSNTWRMIINCEPNKTELICFGTAENNEDLIPSAVDLGNNLIPFVDKTRVLGLTMDKRLSYNDHGIEINKKIIGRWAMICKYSNRNWGFKQNVIVRLIEVIVSSCIQYAGIVWINNTSMKQVNQMWYKLLKSAIGAVFNIKQEIAEVILGVPPIFISHKINSVKHILKLNFVNGGDDSQNDPLKRFINNHLKSNKYSPITAKVKDTFHFLKWKYSQQPKNFTSQDIEIINSLDLEKYKDLSQKCCSYTKGNVKVYSELLWQKTLHGQLQSEGHTDIPMVSSDKLKIPSNMSRQNETLLLSLLYPNNLLNSFLYRYDQARFDSPLCKCGFEEQTANHILLYCPLISYKYRIQVHELLFRNDHQITAPEDANYLLFVSWCKNTEFIQTCINIILEASTYLRCEIVL